MQAFYNSQELKGRVVKREGEIGTAAHDQLARFMQYLKSRELCICNFTSNGIGYWPTDSEAIARNFRVQDQH